MNFNRIFLIGYMGSGKTTVAKVISQQTGFVLVEMDEEIEKAEGSSIRNMFIKLGEHEFRNKESELLDKLCQVNSSIDVILNKVQPDKNDLPGELGQHTDDLPYKSEEESRSTEKKSKYDRFSTISGPGVIVSCGGGIILDDLNRTILKNQYTVFLKGDPNILFDRVNGDCNRPFAFMDIKDEQQRRERFLELYKKREPLYEETASQIINIDGKTPQQIAEEILMHIA